MKRFLISAGIILGVINSSFSQEVSKTVESLVNSQEFAFVALSLEKKPGFNGVNRYENRVSLFPVNYGTLSPSQKLAASQNIHGVGSAYAYTGLNSLSSSYFDVYNIDQKLGAQKKEVKTEVVYLIQQDDQVIMKRELNPNSLQEVADVNLNSYNTNAFALKSIKKKGEIYRLTYRATDKDDNSEFVLEVKEDGSATLKSTPTKTERTYFEGYISQLN